jgi:Fic family protein
MYKYSPVKGGTWKTQDNVIEEVLPNGARFVRFKPVDAFLTPAYMDELCKFYNEEIRKEEAEPLILIAAFVLDFLCIHPFNEGNGKIIMNTNLANAITIYGEFFK